MFLNFIVTIAPPRKKSAVVCAGQTGNIYCPSLLSLQIKAAFFGRQKGRDCTGKVTRDKTPSCSARDTVNILKATCNGQQSCDLYSEPDLYGRTVCPQNVQKYLQVEYTCEGHSDIGEKLNGRENGKVLLKIVNVYIQSCMNFVSHYMEQ